MTPGIFIQSKAMFGMFEMSHKLLGAGDTLRRPRHTPLRYSYMNYADHAVKGLQMLPYR